MWICLSVFFLLEIFFFQLTEKIHCLTNGGYFNALKKIQRLFNIALPLNF